MTGVDEKTVDTILIVPTIRENCCLDFIDRWKKIGLFDEVDLMIMEDNPHKTFNLDGVLNDCKGKLSHLSWQDIAEVLGADEWIIPRRSDTVRSFAYYHASTLGYKYILTLDDDCYPCTDVDGVKYDGRGFIMEHKKNLEGRTQWFNTLNSVKPRGIPFYNLGNNKKTVVNHGLWTNVLDYDAPYQLANPIKEKFSYDNRLIPNGSYFPMCGMNVMWKSEVTVLMYHMLMGHWVGPESAWGERGSYINADGLVKLQFDRFGDIWCGIFMKKIVDMLGYNVSTGMPYIRHERASNPFTNLKKEANGIEVNEKLWQYIDSFDIDDDPRMCSLGDLYYRLGEHVEKYSDFPEHADYFSALGAAMMVWAQLFKASAAGLD